MPRKSICSRKWANPGMLDWNERERERKSVYVIEVSEN